MSAGGKERLTLVLAVLTAVVLALSVPGSLRDAWERGGFYLFSRELLLDLPKRLYGPGRFRFLLQPAVAVALGIAAGADRCQGGTSPARLVEPPRNGLQWRGSRPAGLTTSLKSGRLMA